MPRLPPGGQSRFRSSVSTQCRPGPLAGARFFWAIPFPVRLSPSCPRLGPRGHSPVTHRARHRTHGPTSTDLDVMVASWRHDHDTHHCAVPRHGTRSIVRSRSRRATHAATVSLMQRGVVAPPESTMRRRGVSAPSTTHHAVVMICE